MGWDIDRFPEGEVNLELICCICTGILEDPVESPCRHVFCSLCIKTWLSNQKSCPHCRAPVLKKNLQPVVPLLRSIISKQKLFCDNKDKGCNEVVALESLQSHVAVCSYGTISCTNDGCNVKILRKDLKSHTEVCSKKTIMCDQGCEMFLTLGEKGTHNCVQALRRHFTEVTNEILDKVSKLEELVNVLVSKNNPTVSSHQRPPVNNNNTQRTQHTSHAPIISWSPYTIPSPIPTPTYAVYADDEFTRGDIENHQDFSDSDDSAYSTSRLSSYPLEHLDADGNESPVVERNISPIHPAAFTSDHEDRSSHIRSSIRSRIRNILSEDHNQEERNRIQPSRRHRSRSPQVTSRRSHVVRNRLPSPDTRRRNRRVGNHNENNERIQRQTSTTTNTMQTGDSVVVSIGVSSETVSSESSSSGSSSGSDSD